MRIRETLVSAGKSDAFLKIKGTLLPSHHFFVNSFLIPLQRFRTFLSKEHLKIFLFF